MSTGEAGAEHRPSVIPLSQRSPLKTHNDIKASSFLRPGPSLQNYDQLQEASRFDSACIEPEHLAPGLTVREKRQWPGKCLHIGLCRYYSITVILITPQLLHTRAPSTVPAVVRPLLRPHVSAPAFPR